MLLILEIVHIIVVELKLIKLGSFLEVQGTPFVSNVLIMNNN